MFKIISIIMIFSTLIFSRENINLLKNKIEIPVEIINNLAILKLNMKDFFSKKNPNINNEQERLFQEYIFVYNLIFSKYNFENDIGLKITINKKSNKNIVLVLSKESLKKISNRTYLTDEQNYIETNKFIPPLYPSRNLFLEGKIYKYNSNKLKYSKKVTDEFKLYVKKHLFKDFYKEHIIEKKYAEYHELKDPYTIFSCIVNNVTVCVDDYIKYKFDVNIQNKEGLTPLIFASMDNRYGMVKLLLDNGADPNIHPSDKENAYLVAQRFGYTKIANLLKPLTKITSRYKNKSKGENYKKMCLGIAKNNAINCNMISNQDLKNTCQGIVESYVSCHTIQNSDLKNLCLAKAEGQNSCWNIQDEDLKNSCLGITQNSSFCYKIQDKNIKHMCLGIAKEKHYCYDIH